jgi:predicted RNase H-like nuclease (RuvC/YqgF family)
MDDLHIDLYAFFAVAEVAVVLLAVAAAFFLRSRVLSGRVQTLQRQLQRAQEVPEPVTYDQYLRDAIIRNEAIVEQAAVAEDDAERKAAELLRMRKQFLELELAAHALDNNPVQFQDTLAAGLSELIEQLRPAAETVEVSAAEEPSIAVSAAPPAVSPNSDAGRVTRDTHDDEFDRLKQVINNQQDAVAALRAELKAREADIQDLDTILGKLDEYEQHDLELQQCLKVLERENQRLKAVRSGDDQSRSVSGEGMKPAQLLGLKNMIGNQQKTIANLQDLIRELAPEASKAADLEAAILSIQRANRELNSCVAVLEDENAMLRAELEAVNAQLDSQETAGRTDVAEPDVALAEPDVSVDDDADTGDAMAGQLSVNEKKQQLEIKVQELEALLEFKDAAIEELEKQYNTLESKYLALTGEK